MCVVLCPLRFCALRHCCNASCPLLCRKEKLNRYVRDMRGSGLLCLQLSVALAFARMSGFADDNLIKSGRNFPKRARNLDPTPGSSSQGQGGQRSSGDRAKGGSPKSKGASPKGASPQRDHEQEHCHAQPRSDDPRRDQQREPARDSPFEESLWGWGEDPTLAESPSRQPMPLREVEWFHGPLLASLTRRIPQKGMFTQSLKKRAFIDLDDSSEG